VVVSFDSMFSLLLSRGSRCRSGRGPGRDDAGRRPGERAGGGDPRAFGPVAGLTVEPVQVGAARMSATLTWLDEL